MTALEHVPGEGGGLGARDVLAALRSGVLEAQAVADAAIERAVRAAHLNAFISVVEEVGAPSRAGDAGQRLGGLPIAVKDSIDVRGFPCTGGTPALREWRPRQDPPVVRRLRVAGAVVIGKTNLLSFRWASHGRPAVIEAYRECFARGRLDALVLPTTRLPARPVGQDETVSINGRSVGTLQAYLRNTDPSAVAGPPSMSVPAGLTSSGLPVGLCFDGLPGADATVMALADAFERLGQR